MADEVKVELTLSQRIQANKVLENDLKAAGLGAEMWVSSGAKPGTQVNVFDGPGGVQFARITVSRAGFVQIRDYLKGTSPELMAKIETATGATPNQFTLPVPEYKQGGNFKKFDTSRISK